MKLTVIIASTRPGRIGLTVAEWFIDLARQDGRFDVTVADLAKINLPFLDEPNHPRQQNYLHEHTKAWSELISESEAFVVVTPEYNFSAPATLINALDYLYNEWSYKSVGFVSYGGISGGTRSVEHVKHTMVALKMIPLYEAVNIPFVSNQIDDKGDFLPNDNNEQAAHLMLDVINKNRR